MKTIAIIKKSTLTADGRLYYEYDSPIVNADIKSANSYADERSMKIDESYFVDEFYDLTDAERLQEFVSEAVEAVNNNRKASPLYKIGEKIINVIKEM